MSTGARNPNTRYIVTLDTTTQHDAERRADLNIFLKDMKRRFGLKCRNIQETQIPAKTPVKKRPRAKKANKTEVSAARIPIWKRARVTA